VSSENISPEEEYKIACLLMVFVAVSLPTLASNVMSQYSPAIEGRQPGRCVVVKRLFSDNRFVTADFSFDARRFERFGNS